MDKTIHYLFDPLCGWCYGAAPIVTELLKVPGLRLNLLPTGLFSGEGARPVDDAFAAYAWSNDQRIERLTGQHFSEHYRDQILGDRQQLFDSGPATVALGAVALTEPSKEVEAFRAIQRARYVDGGDVVSLTALTSLLQKLGLKQAAERIMNPDVDLLGFNRDRMVRAQALMREFAARGVPTLIVESGMKRWVLDHSAAYSNPSLLLTQLEAA